MLVLAAGRFGTQQCYSQVSLENWKPMLPSPGIISIHATMAILFVSPLSDDKGGCRKRLSNIHKTGNPIHLIIKIICLGYLLMNTHVGYRYFYDFVYSGCLSLQLFSKLFLTNLMIIFLPNPYHPAKPLTPILQVGI